jgi:hypothetical protein
MVNSKFDQIPHKSIPNRKNLKTWAKGPRTNARQTNYITKNLNENRRIKVTTKTAEGNIQSQLTAAEGGKHQTTIVEI